MDGIKITESPYKILSGRKMFFRVECESGIGIIDIDGNTVILPRFEDVVISPDDGTVEMFIRYRRPQWLNDEDTLFDLVNTKGEILSQDNFGVCIGVREGIAVVKKKFTVEGIKIHPSFTEQIFSVGGKDVKEPCSAGLFHEGMLRVSNKLGYYHCYVDTKGEKKTGFFRGAGDFHHGRAVAARERLMQGDGYGVINKNGQWVVSPRFDYVGNYRNFRALAGKKGKYGFLDTNGNMAVPCVWDNANDFADDGLAFVMQKYPRCACMIDRKGEQKLQLPMDCDWATGFSEDLLPAKRDDKWGYIGRDGRWAIEPQFESIGEFSNGAAPAKRDGKWSFIDKNGGEIMAVEGRLHIVEKGLAHTDTEIFDYREK